MLEEKELTSLIYIIAINEKKPILVIKTAKIENLINIYLINLQKLTNKTSISYKRIPFIL